MALKSSSPRASGIDSLSPWRGSRTWSNQLRTARRSGPSSGPSRSSTSRLAPWLRAVRSGLCSSQNTCAVTSPLLCTRTGVALDIPREPRAERDLEIFYQKEEPARAGLQAAKDEVFVRTRRQRRRRRRRPRAPSSYSCKTTRLGRQAVALARQVVRLARRGSRLESTAARLARQVTVLARRGSALGRQIARLAGQVTVLARRGGALARQIARRTWDYRRRAWPRAAFTGGSGHPKVLSSLRNDLEFFRARSGSSLPQILMAPAFLS